MTLYDQLGVSPAATRDEIAAAAAALGRDAGILLDDARRAAYDRDLAAIAQGYVDVADPLPLEAFARLDLVSAWLPAPEPRAELDGWATHHPALDGNRP
jgi:hypothetical protein